MAHKYHSKKANSSSNSSDSLGCVIGVLILSIVIYLVMFAIGVIGLLFPLILIPMWKRCTTWSKGIKIFISVVLIFIWLFLLPFVFQLFGWLTDDSESNYQASPFPVSTSSTHHSFELTEESSVPSNCTPSVLPTITPSTAVTVVPTLEPTVVPTATPIPILRKGQNGEAVKQMQIRLNSLGYLQAEPDGVFGTQTENAVKEFQKKNGLQIDGVAGEQTLTLMYSNNAKKQIWVWIPTRGGQKHHANPYCSDMVDPKYVTLEEAESLGFEPCGKKTCY